MDPSHFSFWVDRPPVSARCMPIPCPPVQELNLDPERCTLTGETAWIGFMTPFWGCCGGTYPDHKEQS